MHEEARRRHLESTLLGRLRLALYERIAGRPSVWPGRKAVVRHLLGEYRKHVLSARIQDAILHLRHTTVLRHDDLPPAGNVAALLRALERNPLDERAFVELHDCPALFPSRTGVLVRRERLASNGYVYSVTLCAEEGFPEQFPGYLEVRASQADPEPRFVIASAEGLRPFAGEPDGEPGLQLAIRVLAHLDADRPLVYRHPLDWTRSRPDAKPVLEEPDDPVFDTHLHAVLAGQARCSEAIVPFDRVLPFSMDTCLRYPMEVVDELRARFGVGELPRMLVYWSGSHFVMNDDYASYLAYRAARAPRVPVVVMGDFPEEAADVRRRGGAELLPPASFMSYVPWEQRDEDAKAVELEARFSNGEPHAPPELYGLFFTLASALENPATPERFYHALLAKHPLLLDPAQAAVLSEVSLGEYRIDLVLKFETSERRLLFVELERPSHRLFTKTGRPRKEVTHAVQQVEDWLRWWRRNPSRAPEGLDPALHPEGLVVIGRSRDLDPAEKERLYHLNQTRHVQVVTYDDLLEKLETLILNLEGP